MVIFADDSFYALEYLCGREAAVTDPSTYFFLEATQEIKRYTGKNIDEDNIPECVKMCCCEIAELICAYKKFLAQSEGKTSESVQGWSASYESPEQKTAEHEKNIRSCIYKWLSGTGLLYRGVR